MKNNYKDRYAKQILFQPIGEKGQAKIADSTVTIIGRGALDTISCSHLSRAGAGRLRIVDRDFVELSNLQRQFLFDEQDVEQCLPKAVAAANKLKKINSEIAIEPLTVDVSPRNIEKIIKESDIVLEGTNNLETRFLINDACLKNNLPWIYAAALGSTAACMTIIPHQTPCLRCYMSQPPSPGTLPSCDTVGVLSMTTGTIASLQSAEALRLLAGFEPTNFFLYIDVWHREFETIKIEKRPDCDTCGKNKDVYLDGLHTSLHGLQFYVDEMPSRLHPQPKRTSIWNYLKNALTK